MEVIPFVRSKNACDYHRIILPLERLGISTRLQPNSLPDGFKDCKVLIFNRFCPFDIGHISKYRFEYGFKIICDLDDYWHLYPNHVAERAWKATDTTQKMMEGILNADAVWVTTKRLADQVIQYNKEVHVIPNALPFDEGQFSPDRNESDTCRVIYAGGSSHMRDLLTIKHVFNKLSTVDFQMVLAGYDSRHPEFWDKMEKILTANGKIKNFIRKEFLPLDSYMSLYNRCDISIAPLEDNFFNTFKSNLKILEAGAKYMSVVTSNTPPYSDEIEPVLMASGVGNWYTLLHRLIKDKVYRQEQGQWLGEYVRENYHLDKVNIIRKQILKHYGATI